MTGMLHPPFCFATFSGLLGRILSNMDVISFSLIKLVRCSLLMPWRAKRKLSLYAFLLVVDCNKFSTQMVVQLKAFPTLPQPPLSALIRGPGDCNMEHCRSPLIKAHSISHDTKHAILVFQMRKVLWWSFGRRWGMTHTKFIHIANGCIILALLLN